jgi:hypothetical protein
VPSSEELSNKERKEKKGKLDLAEILYAWAENKDEGVEELKERILQA